MSADQTPVEMIAIEIAADMDGLVNDFLARPGGDAESQRRRAVLQEFLWENKVGLLRVTQAYGELVADLRETLRAVLHHFGPEGVHKISSHAVAARKVRESNAEIDALEKIFASPITAGRRGEP